ncbi:hypothetical protein [Williamsia sp. CHRR-6]|uniref:hypothetical protein n=1 Tax=Williamsia sp. CHRR-6 TaxID=2835871 RepID=UPI001BDA3051|nr:hypothetical protein [Williamsia sp. CHRR-6]MBT0566266.1 hypothetical protein [Williamsia sp. CHRR-6]
MIKVILSLLLIFFVASGCASDKMQDSKKYAAETITPDQLCTLLKPVDLTSVLGADESAYNTPVPKTDREFRECEWSTGIRSVTYRIWKPPTPDIFPRIARTRFEVRKGWTAYVAVSVARSGCGATIARDPKTVYFLGVSYYAFGTYQEGDCKLLAASANKILDAVRF